MDIIAFVLTEPGAMGMGGLFACITNKKEYAEYNYVNGDISYLELCQLFPIINKCVFNGAMPFDVVQDDGVIITNNANRKSTYVPEDWKHIYMKYGRHLVIREEYYDGLTCAVDISDYRYLIKHWNEVIANGII